MRAVDGEVEGYVALVGVELVLVSRDYRGREYHGDGHDGRVGDVDCAVHVHPCLADLDVEVWDVEAFQFVQGYSISPQHHSSRRKRTYPS